MVRFSALWSALTSVTGFVPKKARMLVALSGLSIVFICVAVMIRMTWDAELDELVFGFIGMFILVALIMMRAGGKDDPE